MSADTLQRILVSAIAMCLDVVTGVPAVRSGSLHLWVFGLLLAFAAAVGLLSPEIERAWTRIRLWDGDRRRRTK